MRIQMAYHYLMQGTIYILIFFVCCCLIRAIKGPKIADRIVAINMIGTMINIIIAILAVYLQESYLIDICIIYAMISFLAVVVISKVYMGVYKEKKEKEKNNGSSI